MEELTQQFITVLVATQQSLSDIVGNTKGESITVLLTSCLTGWFGISCMTTDNFCFYLQNRLSQTSQIGGQWYSDTSPFSIPWTLAYYLDFVQL